MQAAIRAFETLFAGATANYLTRFSTAVDLTTIADYFRPPFRIAQLLVQQPAIGRNHHLRVDLAVGDYLLSFEFHSDGTIKTTRNPFSEASGRLQVQVLQYLANYLRIGVNLPQLQTSSVTLKAPVIPGLDNFRFSDERLDAWFRRGDLQAHFVARLNRFRPATWTENIEMNVYRSGGNKALTIRLGSTGGVIMVHTTGKVQSMGTKMPEILHVFLPYLVQGMLHLSGWRSNDYDVDMALMTLQDAPRAGPIRQRRRRAGGRAVRPRGAGAANLMALVAARVDAVADQHAQVVGNALASTLAAADDDDEQILDAAVGAVTPAVAGEQEVNVEVGQEEEPPAATAAANADGELFLLGVTEREHYSDADQEDDLFREIDDEHTALDAEEQRELQEFGNSLLHN